MERIEPPAGAGAAAAKSPGKTPAPSNTASPEYSAYLRAITRKRNLVWAWQIGIVVFVLAIWEIAPRAGWINPMLSSSPSSVFRTFVAFSADGSLLRHTGATLLSTIIGFTGSMVIGIPAALMLWAAPMLHRVIDPFLVVANALPKVALVPIFYIWLGDLTSIYAMAIVVSVFVTILMLYTGFRSIDSDKIRLVRLYGATPMQIIKIIVLPGSVPTMIATLKVNVGLSLIGVVVGEFQSAKEGLGYLITYGSQIFQMNLVMMSVVVLALISAVLFGFIQAFERRIYRRTGWAAV